MIIFHNDLRLQMKILGNSEDRYIIEINPKKTKIMIFLEQNKTKNETLKESFYTAYSENCDRFDEDIFH